MGADRSTSPGARTCAGTSFFRGRIRRLPRSGERRKPHRPFLSRTGSAGLASDPHGPGPETGGRSMRAFSPSRQTTRLRRAVAGRDPARPAAYRRFFRPGVEPLEARVQLSQLFTVPGAPGQLVDVHFALTAGKSA